MKTLKIFLLTQFVAISLFSQNTLTVNNNPGFVANGITTFTDLQTAIDYASAGDVVYVVGTPHYEPGPISYGNIEINKQLHLIGDGYHADPAKGYEKVTSINSINIIDGADGSIVEGILINYIYGRPSTNSLINNVIIKNNYVAKTFVIKYNTTEKFTGWQIKNNIINILNGLNNGNLNLGDVLIVNNIITSYLKNIRSSEPIIAHNLFLRGNNSFENVSDATFSSNIFYTSSLEGCTRCSFYNNLVFDPYNQANLTFNYGDNITNGTNLENVDPNFVNAVAGFLWENDYHLQPGSPALTAGPGGIEIGIYSETGSPFPERYGPPTPKINELQIENRLIEPGQQLQINIKAGN